MHESMLQYLAGPCCGGDLTVTDGARRDVSFSGEIYEGQLNCGCGCTYEVIKGVPVLLVVPTQKPLNPDDAVVLKNQETWLMH